MSAPLDSRQLRALATVARTGSFTLAAKQLHLTQSAISHAMKALERDVGCRLLDRLGKTVVLTQAGEQLLQRAERILQEMDDARTELAHLRQWGYTRLRLGAGPTACQYLLPPVLREFKEDFPRCNISIEPSDALQLLELLRSQRVDLALTLQPQRAEEFEFRPLFTDELQFIVSPRHPWALLGRVPRAEIAQQHFILYNRQSYTFGMIERYLAAEQISLRSFIEFGSMEAIKEMVKLGLGVGILAPWITRQELEDRTLVALPLGQRKIKRHWGILHRSARRLGLPEETFIGLCQSVAETIA